MGVEKAAARPAAVPISTQSRWLASECDGPAQPRGSRIPSAFAIDLQHVTPLFAIGVLI